jgi:hypothetical protein
MVDRVVARTTAILFAHQYFARFCFRDASENGQRQKCRRDSLVS